MRTLPKLVVLALVALAPLARAQTTPAAGEAPPSFFIGARGGIAVPPDAKGFAELAGVEVGTLPEGVTGWGVHLISSFNTPDMPSLNVQSVPVAFGVEGDVRWYVHKSDQGLDLFPELSAGFVVGQTKDGNNEVLPLLDPGFGARLHTQNGYVSVEFGLADMFMPFISFSFGFMTGFPATPPAAAVDSAPAVNATPVAR